MRETLAETDLGALECHEPDRTVEYDVSLGEYEVKTGTHHIEHVFAVELPDAPITLSEAHTDYNWLTTKTFINTIWYTTARKHLKEVVAVVEGLN